VADSEETRQKIKELVSTGRRLHGAGWGAGSAIVELFPDAPPDAFVVTDSIGSLGPDSPPSMVLGLMGDSLALLEAHCADGMWSCDVRLVAMRDVRVSIEHRDQSAVPATQLGPEFAARATIQIPADESWTVTAKIGVSDGAPPLPWIRRLITAKAATG